MAVAILSGEKQVANIPFEYYAQESTFFINENNAKAAGLTQELINSLKENHNK